jgi:site-specific DNA-cytosine methylase
VLELFAGVGATTQALTRVGYAIGELRCAAQQVYHHTFAQLMKEFPARASSKVEAQLHLRIPQDIRIVTADHLQDLGPIDLVVAGWPCEGSSAAGTGQGLDGRRSGLLVKLLRMLHVMQVLEKARGQPLGYLIEHGMWQLAMTSGPRSGKILRPLKGCRGQKSSWMRHS